MEFGRIQTDSPLEKLARYMPVCAYLSLPNRLKQYAIIYGAHWIMLPRSYSFTPLDSFYLINLFYGRLPTTIPSISVIIMTQRVEFKSG